MAIIQRLPADKPGEEIVSPILINDTLCIERGRQEINYNDSDRVIKVGQLLDSDFVRPGSIVEIQDKTGATRGKVTGFSLAIRATEKEISTSANITVECVK